MTDNTINNDMTMGGATATLLAGRYRVVRQLGQGGMGSVWLAEDEKLDGFKVAIKMLPSVLVNNKRAYAQVKAEALVSLKLSHPNIATVRAFEEESGSPFLVMDYIDGQTLDDYLAEKGKLSEDEAIRLLKPVAAALDYAHAQGVVHRDVKPGNVMIRKDGTPFVLDFGIAREIQETMTRVTGKLSSGTLLYMSPEQLRGAIPTPAQDIYSFAAMAYECLAGSPPFARGQIEYQIEHVEPEPLGPQFANYGPGVMAGLEKRPENRPASCVAVLTSSRGNGGGRSPRPTPESRQETPRSPARTAGGKGLVVGLIVALTLAGAGAYHYISVKNEERRRSGEAQVTFERALTSLNEYERKIERISREDGFGSRIDEINEKIPSRIALKDVSSFLSAAERCAGLEKECRQLLTADELRIQAKTVRDAAQQARQKVQNQSASQDACETWQKAESAYGQGHREFANFDFGNAQQSFVHSEQLYEKAASEAAMARVERQKAERAQLEQKAKEEERRKKNEKEIADLRAACETAKKAAEAAEAAEFATKEMSNALKLLDDADNVTDGDRKQAYLTASNAFERARQVAMEASKPKVTLKAMLNGEEVNATVISGLKDKTRKTPVVVDLSGLRIGSACEFELVYHCDGMQYTGKGCYSVKKGKSLFPIELSLEERAHEGNPSRRHEYVVMEGDTLALVALAFGVTVDGIRQLNNLNDDVLYVGQKLQIPVVKALSNKMSRRGSDKSNGVELVPLVTPVVDTDGFTYIFNGQDLSGWFGSADCTVRSGEQGELVCTRGGLFSEREYSDFILRFEFCMPENGAGGLGLRVLDINRDPAYYGMGKISLIDDGGSSYYDAESGRDRLHRWQYTGSLYGLVPSRRDNVNRQIWGRDRRFSGGGSYLCKAGMWNFCEVYVRGSGVSVVLNGQLVMMCDVSNLSGSSADGRDHPGLRNRKGRIALLGNVTWRNVRIRELEGDSPVGRKSVPRGFDVLFSGKPSDLQENWMGVTTDDKYDNPLVRQMASSDVRQRCQAAADNAMRGHWSIRYGNLFFDGFKGGYSIATKRQYADFELLVDWRLLSLGGDSGLYLRGCPQVQIWDAFNQWRKGSGALYNNKKNLDSALKIADHPIGTWNTFRIRMVGEKVTVWLNDELVTDNVTMENYWDRSRPIFPVERIELQCHGDPVEFRNIFIREL